MVHIESRMETNKNKEGKAQAMLAVKDDFMTG